MPIQHFHCSCASLWSCCNLLLSQYLEMEIIARAVSVI